MKKVFIFALTAVVLTASCERIPKKAEEQYRVGIRAALEKDWS